MKHATARIQELEKSIATDREINRLQNRCKDLYHDEDEIVLRRIGDISDRAARRDFENQQRIVNSQFSKNLEQHQLSKDYQIQLHDNFQHSNDTNEKFPIRSRTNSGCANNNKLISEKTLSISSLQH